MFVKLIHPFVWFINCITNCIYGWLFVNVNVSVPEPLAAVLYTYVLLLLVKDPVPNAGATLIPPTIPGLVNPLQE